MTVRVHAWILSVGIALVLLLAQQATGQVARSGGGDSRAMQQLQQLAQERTALQAENARLKSELQKAKAEASAASAAAATARTRLASAEAAAARAAVVNRTEDSELGEVRARLAEVVGRYRELAENLRVVETERNSARSESAQQTRALARCTQANVELYGIADEVLGRYENAGVAQALGRAEPFTRLTRTRMENLVDEYRVRANELKEAPVGAVDTASNARLP